MCGRFALASPLDEMVEDFGIEHVEPFEHRANRDVRPTQSIPVVISQDGSRRLLRMRWGFLPRWYRTPTDGPLIINARSETIAEKPAFREACRQRRCLIPANGFYEWQAIAGERRKRVHWIAPEGEGLFGFAGVWQLWTGTEGGSIATCAIVTCAADGALAAIHERLPVAIDRQDRALWLGEAGHGAARLMRPAPPGWWHVTPDRGPG
ncbi:MAG: SOS response-associated peptidase [Rubricella sp.]